MVFFDTKERLEDIEDKHCENCDKEQPHKYYGMVPAQMLGASASSSWAETAICRVCLSLTVIEIDEEALVEEEDEYMELLVENDKLSEEEAEEIKTSE